MMLALFRIIEASSGKILIDNIDISKVKLKDLRKGISIIPQEPVLFSGDIRFNLDPFEEYNDDYLWEILEKCNLKEFVQNLKNGLNSLVYEGGDNFSLGERQLICLARAIAKKSKILIMDEATASVDYVTDNLIQSTIKKEFVGCTRLTIAHRIHTIIDSDKILVLSNGNVAEFEYFLFLKISTPKNLIMNKNSNFYSMVMETGSNSKILIDSILNSK
jgi:ABC-type multidrug transport system fused ATPase/permease subunit